MRSLSTSFNFSEKKDFQLLLRWFLFSIAIYSILEVFRQKSNIGLLPDEIINNVLGDSRNFMPSLNIGELAEILHIRLFLVNIIFLILFSSLNRFTNQRNKVLSIISTGYIFIVFEIISLLGVRFISTYFAYIYAVFFLLVQVFIFALCLVAIRKIARA